MLILFVGLISIRNSWADPFTVGVQYNPVVEGAGQNEYIVADFETVPGFDPSVVFFFYSLDPSVVALCQGGVVSSGCFSTFQALGMRRHADMGKHVFDFVGVPQTNGSIYFFVAAVGTDTTGMRWGVSDLGQVQIIASNSPVPMDVRNFDPDFFTRPLAAPVRDTALPTNPDDMIVVSNGTYGAAGDDTNCNGTLACPFLTLVRAKQEARQRWPNASARAGKRIVIRGGRYLNARGPLAGAYDFNFTRETYFNWHGVEGGHFKVMGYPFDPELPTFDFHRYDPASIYFHPLDPHAFDAWTWGDNYLGWGGDITGVRHFSIEGIRFYGGRQEGLNIDNVYDVKIRFVEIHNALKWGMQAFGQDVARLAIEGCTVLGTLLEHGIYIAAGAHAPEVSRDILIHHNTLMYNGRFGVQVNGKHEFVRIENNKIGRNYLGGIADTGNANIQIKGNTIFENIKQGIVLAYSYVDGSYWDIGNSASMQDWAQKHFRVAAHHYVKDNTIVVRSERWDPRVSDPPGSFPAIVLPTDHGYLPSLGGFAMHAPKDIVIENNTIYGITPRTLSVYLESSTMDFRGYKMMDGLSVKRNRIFTEGGNSLFCTPFTELYCRSGDIRPISVMEMLYPANWSANVMGIRPNFVRFAPVEEIPTDQGRIDYWIWNQTHPVQSDYRIVSPTETDQHLH